MSETRTSRRVDAIHLRIEAEMRAGLEAAAAAEGRTLSGLVHRILAEWLHRQGLRKS
jgi:uncharacterized protein (DUF1778 family)